MSNWQLKTPVAFIIFNRPDTTARVFSEIAKVKPPKLLVVADGARSNRQGEVDKVAATRAIIEQVNWPCEVVTNFSDKNLGCKNRVSTGIDWVFEQVPEAIILEDDCLPDPSFFRFCEEMLEKYRHDQRVGIVSGDNLQFGNRRNNDSYYFSKYVHIWGWASWRDRWQSSYDVNMQKWPEVKDGNWIIDIVRNKKEASVWTSIFDRTFYNKVDTWDYQWVFANWTQGRLSIVPNVNLISNIGFFRADATHTTGGGDEAQLPTQEMSFPLKHPALIVANLKADNFEYKRLIKRSFLKRVYNKFLSFYSKLN